MTTADLVIHGGQVVSPDSVIEASVAIHDGHIIAVGSEAAMPPARETLDARGLHVLPGAIDVHVHFAIRAIRTRRIGRPAPRPRRSAA
jgi:dihydroorotase